MDKIYEEEFQVRVLNVEHPVVVDFYADWCGPCKMLSPILDQLEKENDDIATKTPRSRINMRSCQFQTSESSNTESLLTGL